MPKTPWQERLRAGLRWLTGVADTPISTDPGLLSFVLTEGGAALPILYASRYTEEVSQHIHRAKYGADWATATALARLMRALQAPPHWARTPVCLVPVPPDPARLRARGFHLPALLAKSLGGHWKMAVSLGGLTKTRSSPEQARRSRQDRQAMDAAVFQATRPMRRRTVILVDDVMTTGATLSAAARAWQRNGGEVLGAAVLAYVPAPGSSQPSRSAMLPTQSWHTALWERTEGIR